MDLDRETANRIDGGLPVPQNTFKPSLFRQPSLAEGPIRPKAYRSRVGSKSPSSSSKANTPGDDVFLTPPPPPIDTPTTTPRLMFQRWTDSVIDLPLLYSTLPYTVYTLDYL